MKRTGPLALAAALLWAGSASAFSFAPGGFGGDHVATIQLSGVASYTATGDALTIAADVTTITMSSTTVYNIPAGDVVFNSSVFLVPGSLSVVPFVLAVADFANGAVDFDLVDVADSSNLLLQGDFAGDLAWNVTENQNPQVVTGAVGADFAIVGGDPAFLAAVSSPSSFGGNLSGFVPSTLCEVVGNCFAPDMVDWSAGAALDIEVAPEPGTLGLLGAALAGLAALARRRRA